MSEQHPEVELHSIKQAFWDCPNCGLRNTDNDNHIYIEGDLEECQHCGLGVQLTAPTSINQ
jgi:predicted RNA-binding Zn-ribbon protein involved in translation (DUF1610 family)